MRGRKRHRKKAKQAVARHPMLWWVASRKVFADMLKEPAQP